MNVWQYSTLIAACITVANTAPAGLGGYLLVLSSTIIYLIATIHFVMTKGWTK